MKYSVTFQEEDYEALVAHLFSHGNVERAAYLLCRPSITDSETRLIVREVVPVEEHEVAESSHVHMKIPSISFRRILKHADDTKQCFVFVHSHPSDVPYHSEQDDFEELKMFRTAYIRIATKGVHGSIVISSPTNPQGRVWLEDGTNVPIWVIRTIGKKFRFFSDRIKSSTHNVQLFDRQIRAFGSDIQRLLGNLTIGIVGVGGTGSSVAEQLIRLGVGHLVISDSQELESSNVNRVYGSRISDDGTLKISLIERLARDIGTGTVVTPFEKDITFESIIREFRKCDIIFGCTDDEWGRSILTKFAIYYLIPIFDLGVKIKSEDDTIKSVEGRITTLLPGEACLFCRGRINPKNVLSESLEATNPQEARTLRREGYIPELAEPAPAVVPFTTTIASGSISELLHRLTGYLGIDRVSSEVIYQFHNSRIRTNRFPPKPDCFCTDQKYIGRADSRPFLDLTWRPE